MAPRVRSERAMTSNCVRFDDKRGCSFRLNKTGLRSPVKKKLFSYFVKCYEQECRGESESAAVLKKFEMFRSVYERFPRLTPLPEGFDRLEQTEKQSTLMQLASEQLDDAERVYLEFQGGDTQADYPGDMQLGERSGPDLAPEGVTNTLRPPDSSLQNVPLGSVHSEGAPGVPLGFTPGLGSCTLHQLDHPEGRPPPSSRQCPHDLNQSMSDVECRAFRYPDMWQELCWLKKRFILFEDKLKDRERNERLSLEWRSNLRRKSLEEIPSRLPEGILAEDPQNQLRKTSMEDAGFQDVGFQGSYYPASDFGVKNIGNPVPYGEEDGLLRNRSISEALEVVPRFTGRYRKNVGDIRPEVYSGSADGDLPRKPKIEGFSPKASDLCSGGESVVIKSNPGGNNTLQIVGLDRFISAEPPADKQEQWAERLLCQFDMPLEEDPSYLWHSPVRYVSIDTIPA